ncbi:MAG: RNA methyltransferase [Elusimicrobia bacterium]|nr:RNA methyltransferase [Elusimicrobiota bacterium]
MAPPLKVRFVLVRSRNSLNMGAAARAMANFGFKDLAAVEPFEPRWREAASAVHGADILARAPVVTLEESVADCALVLGTASAHNRRLRQPLVPLPSLAAFTARRLRAGGRAAVLFGSEKTGLTNDQLGRCHALVRIPTRADAPSMNLGQAVACVAYELARGGLEKEVRRAEDPAPTAEQLEALVEAGLGALAKANYNLHMPVPTRRAYLRRALLRWSMTRGDAAFLQGLFRRLS